MMKQISTKGKAVSFGTVNQFHGMSASKINDKYVYDLFRRN